MILITRPEPGARETAARIRAMGYAPVIASVSHVRTTPARLPPPESLAGILLTSGNAIPAFDLEYHDVPVWAVGRATAERAREAGFQAVVSADGDAIALARLVAGSIQPSRRPLLLASGRGQGRGLARDLREQGFRMLRRVVYAVDPVRVLPPDAVVALGERTVTHVLFFSAETARIFERLARRAGLISCMTSSEAVAISPRTAMALRSLPWRRITVAVTPDQDALLALLP